MCVIEKFDHAGLIAIYRDKLILDEKKSVSRVAPSFEEFGEEKKNKLAMSKIEAYQLSHPELLSEGTLCEILENSCIALPAFKSLSKEELVEIFKRIALPMPQRRYNETRILGKALSDLRTKKGVKTATYSDENTDIPSESSRTTDGKNQQDGADDCSGKNRLKPPISDSQQKSKKIRLSNSCHMENLAEKDAKRKNEVSTVSESKKRQKITWP